MSQSDWTDDEANVLADSVVQHAKNSEGEHGDDPFVVNRNTDRANGEEFARLFRMSAVWVPGLDWLLYDGKRWVPDGGLARFRMVEKLVRRLSIAQEVATNDEGRTAYKGRIRRLESVQGVNGALTFAASELEIPLALLDADPLLINFPNGTYDAEKRTLRKHDPADYITRLCPTEYHPDAEDAVWDRVLAEVFDGDSDHEDAKLQYLRRFAGYTLLGLTNEKKVLVPYGPRDTGKSTVTEALYRALGDVADGGYATTWDAEVVEASTRVNRNEKLDKARAARMVVTGELDKGSRMADGFIKRFSGGDTVDACAKYKPSYSYRPQGKLWMPTNFVPRSADKAVQGRLALLPFRHVPEKLDGSVKLHLDADDDAHQAVLAWAMRGLEEYLDARDAGVQWPLGEAPWLDSLLRAYAKESDALLDFIEACFDEAEIRDLQAGEDDGSPYVEHVWRAYFAWSGDNVPKALKRRTFEYALEERGFERGRVPSHGGTMRWRGLKWRPAHEVPDTVKTYLKLTEKGV